MASDVGQQDQHRPSGGGFIRMKKWNTNKGEKQAIKEFCDR
jgi:hypothetical protein